MSRAEKSFVGYNSRVSFAQDMTAEKMGIKKETKDKIGWDGKEGEEDPSPARFKVSASTISNVY